jgi:EF hand
MAMTFMKNLLAGLSLLGIFAADAGAQIVREDHVDPRTISPAEPKNMPPQSPGAPTSAGAIVVRYKVEVLDKDWDGLVSRAEVISLSMPELLRVFDQLDRNRDGKLEQRELDRFVK